MSEGNGDCQLPIADWQRHHKPSQFEFGDHGGKDSQNSTDQSAIGTWQLLQSITTSGR